jgi:hypothetical protein
MLPQSCWRVQGLCDHTDGIHCYFVTAAVQAASAVSVANFYRIDHRMYKAAEPGERLQARVKPERGQRDLVHSTDMDARSAEGILQAPEVYVFCGRADRGARGDQNHTFPLCGL